MNINTIEKVKDKLFEVEFEFTEEEYERIRQWAAQAGTTPEDYLKSLMERGV